MKDLIRDIGEMTATLITIIIPMLVVIGFYENWYNFIKLILVMLFIGDFIAIGTIIHIIQDEL